MPKTYNETRVGVLDGDEIEVITEKAYDTRKEKATKEGAVAPEAKTLQTFTRYIAENWADCEAIIPNEVERVNLFQRALQIKETDLMREKLKDENFQPVEGAYDLGPELNIVSERKKASPEEKALKGLLELSPEALADVLAQIMALKGQASTTA